MRLGWVKTSKLAYRNLTASSSVKEIMFVLEESLSNHSQNDTVNVLILHKGLSAVKSTSSVAVTRYGFHLHFWVPCDKWTNNNNGGYLLTSKCIYYYNNDIIAFLFFTWCVIDIIYSWMVVYFFLNATI